MTKGNRNLFLLTNKSFRQKKHAQAKPLSLFLGSLKLGKIIFLLLSHLLASSIKNSATKEHQNFCKNYCHVNDRTKHPQNSGSS